MKKLFVITGLLSLFLMTLLNVSFAETEQAAPFPKMSAAFSGTCVPVESPPIRPKNGDSIHNGINLMGRIYHYGSYTGDFWRYYNNNTMCNVIHAYWGSNADFSCDTSNGYVSWGGRPLDGYVVYAITRVALLFRNKIQLYYPDTILNLEKMLCDYASRDIDNLDEERFLHEEGVNASQWNSRSEDYMGYALGYAAADAWFGRGEYKQKVLRAVEIAFTIGTPTSTPHTLIQGNDPKENDGISHVMLRNHGQLNPVYAMAVIKHLGDVNEVYKEALQSPILPDRNRNIPDLITLEKLYNWVVAKIKTDRGPVGLGRHTFEDSACLDKNGVYVHCDDSKKGDQREPGHYPLGAFLSEFDIEDDNLDLFGPPFGWNGPACIMQKAHNFYYNYNFANVAQDNLPVLMTRYYGAGGPTYINDWSGCEDTVPTAEFIFNPDLGRFEERPEGGCFPVYQRKNNPTFVKVQIHPKGHFFVEGKCRDNWYVDSNGNKKWLTLHQSILNKINIGGISVINTDPYQSQPSNVCFWGTEPRYLNILDEGYFEIYLKDDKGKEFHRKVKLKLIGKE